MAGGFLRLPLSPFLLPFGAFLVSNAYLCSDGARQALGSWTAALKVCNVKNTNIKTMKDMKRMVTLRVLLVALSLLCCFGAVAQVKVVDAESGLPVSYASVYDDATGKMLGITTSEGAVPAKANACATISVQHINYDPATVAVAGIKDNTLRLTPREAYQVKEVPVGKEKHDYARIKFYVRQYSMVNGKIASVGESLNYGYYNMKKKKLEKQLSISSKILRNEEVFKDQKWQIKSVGELANDLPGSDVSDVIKDFDKYDDGKKHYFYYKNQKYKTVFVRHDDKAQRMELVQDSGFVERPFNVWILGVSLSDCYRTSTFSSVYGKPSLSTWQSSVSSLRITHNKTQAYADRYAEMYPIGIDYADKADFKAQRNEIEEKKKNGTQEAFVRPEGFPPFNKYVTEAMEHMTEVK